MNAHAMYFVLEFLKAFSIEQNHDVDSAKKNKYFSSEFEKEQKCFEYLLLL